MWTTTYHSNGTITMKVIEYYNTLPDFPYIEYVTPRLTPSYDPDKFLCEQCRNKIAQGEVVVCGCYIPERDSATCKGT